MTKKGKAEQLPDEDDHRDLIGRVYSSGLFEFRIVGTDPSNPATHVIAKLVSDKPVSWPVSAKVVRSSIEVDAGRKRERESMDSELFDLIATGETEAVEALIAARPELLREKNRLGHTPLMWAAYHMKREMVELLLKGGAVPGIFEAAAIGDLKALVEGLNADPARVNEYSPDGWTPLHLAAFFGHREEVACLLERGADVCAVSHNGLEILPLQSALANHQADVAIELLARGADVDASGCGNGSYRPIHYVAANGDSGLMRQLLETGADFKVRNSAGETPLELAIKHGHKNLEEMLRAYGATE